MILKAYVLDEEANAFPRIRGGDPGISFPASKVVKLFPAYAGVIPASLNDLKSSKTFPRIRGGDPEALEVVETLKNFSPHTRG